VDFIVTNQNILYRAFGSDGALLYVGATTSIGDRVKAHSRTQPWWDEASNITLERYDTLEALLAAEKAAIQIEAPRYNTMHLRPPIWAMKPRRPRGTGTIYRRADGLWVGRVELPPGPDGKRRRKHVGSKDRATAIRKFEELKAAVAHAQ
jgi:hypothetical protein